LARTRMAVFPSALDRHFLLLPQQCAPTSTLETLDCVAKGFYVAVASVGFHAVAVFLILSGFGLTFSLARTGEPTAAGGVGTEDGCCGFPMYWLAHLSISSLLLFHGQNPSIIVSS
jgi:peptidoglycan/LPS O-acetylase OafA/YrhL